MATILEERSGHLIPKYKPHRCYHCKSLIQYILSDIDMDKVGGTWITCPVCDIIVDALCLEKNSTSTESIEF